MKNRSIGRFLRFGLHTPTPSISRKFTLEGGAVSKNRFPEIRSPLPPGNLAGGASRPGRAGEVPGTGGWLVLPAGMPRLVVSPAGVCRARGPPPRGGVPGPEVRRRGRPRRGPPPRGGCRSVPAPGVCAPGGFAGRVSRRSPPGFSAGIGGAAGALARVLRACYRKPFFGPRLVTKKTQKDKKNIRER